MPCRFFVSARRSRCQGDRRRESAHRRAASQRRVSPAYIAYRSDVQPIHIVPIARASRDRSRFAPRWEPSKAVRARRAGSGCGWAFRVLSSGGRWVRDQGARAADWSRDALSAGADQADALARRAAEQIANAADRGSLGNTPPPVGSDPPGQHCRGTRVCLAATRRWPGTRGPTEHLHAPPLPEGRAARP